MNIKNSKSSRIQMNTPIKYIIVQVLLAGLAAVASIGVVQAREPVQIDPFILPPNRCGFPINFDVVVNDEYQEVITLDDGTTITNITGNLVLSFTNTINGFTITRELNGPTTETE